MGTKQLDLHEAPPIPSEPWSDGGEHHCNCNTKNKGLDSQVAVGFAQIVSS
jgi:hypothetical protein